MLPKAKSTFLLIADIIPTTNSGSDVPNAINDNPMTASETLYFFAISIADLTNKSEPKTKKIIPNTININDTIDICKKYNFFSCGINLNLFSKSIVSKFVKNEIQVTVYHDKNISEVKAHNLWSNKVSSIFIDDPSEYF